MGEGGNCCWVIRKVRGGVGRTYLRDKIMSVGYYVWVGELVGEIFLVCLLILGVGGVGVDGGRDKIM